MLSRSVAAAAAVTAVTLVLLAVLFLGANLGWSPAAFWLLCAVPLTVGLPASCGVFAVTALWNGPPVWGWIACAAAAAFALQLAAHAAVRGVSTRWRARWRARSAA